MADEAAIRATLDTLYACFTHGQGEEPDWATMRASFLEGAVFIPEPPAGQPLKPQSVDELVAGWQRSLRRRPPAYPGYTETIQEVRITQTGRVAHVDVVFLGSEAGDTHARSMGLDSLQLIQESGRWLVVAFTVQEESKLEPSN